VPEHVRNAVLAAEDRTFYENRGISPRGIARAFVNNVRGGGQQGGSTITQQYVKNTYLQPDRTLQRKTKEFFIALKVDSELSKDEILEGYLNTIYWGRGAYGIEAAAKAYFSTNARSLTPSQGAFLAGIIQAPSRFELTKNRAGAERRWAYVLDGMVEKGWLSANERADLIFPDVAPKSVKQRLGGPTGYLLNEVKNELIRLGFDEDEVDAGGLRITSTFNFQAQRAARDAVRDEFPKQNNARVHVGLASVRPGDGAVLAMWGGRDYVRQSFNDATQAGLPIGSTYKPFTLVAALQNGKSMRSRYRGNSPLELDGDKPVRNEFNEDYGDRIDLYKALEESVNTAFVDLTMDVGPDKVKRAGEAAGLDRNVRGLNADARVTLGSADTSPLVLANAYATIAARGVRAEPYMVKQVVGPNGGTRHTARPKTLPNAFGDNSEDITSDVVDAMRKVIEDGTGRRARELDRPAAGKTGTAAQSGRARTATARRPTTCPRGSPDSRPRWRPPSASTGTR
jgi:membrane peptidoglycan carboxypeptidase